MELKSRRPCHSHGPPLLFVSNVSTFWKRWGWFLAGVPVTKHPKTLFTKRLRELKRQSLFTRLNLKLTRSVIDCTLMSSKGTSSAKLGTSSAQANQQAHRRLPLLRAGRQQQPSVSGRLTSIECCTRCRPRVRRRRRRRVLGCGVGLRLAEPLEG